MEADFGGKITGSVCTIGFNGHSSYPGETKTKQIDMTFKPENKPAGIGETMPY